jgi:hypothetical protein
MPKMPRVGNWPQGPGVEGGGLHAVLGEVELVTWRKKATTHHATPKPKAPKPPKAPKATTAKKPKAVKPKASQLKPKKGAIHRFKLGGVHKHGGGF